ncbi:MAG: UDPGP type 1 family protein [Planctomycetes bacterium]|nr:UDPGP type 1 family protein [Planctomycetota bacterium]
MSELRAKFETAGQGHVFAWWDELGERARRRLTRQLEAVDLSRLPEMLAAVEALKSPRARNLSPAPTYALGDETFPYALDDAARALAPQGEKELRDGRVGVLLVAGGQGTRLGFDGPKGCYPILPLTGMTLFEVFARKLLRVGREYGRTPPLYVMVGRHNEAATRNFWEDHDWFGLCPEDVQFFAQGEMPALDDDGKLVMSGKDALFSGPDGHGGVVQALHRQGLTADMRRRGIRTISYLQVDNLQTPVADPAFIGLHLGEGAEVSLKVVRKQDPNERVGVFCHDDGVPCIVEYSEFSEQQAREQSEDGRLRYWQGSIAVHLFSTDFLARLGDRNIDLPLHAARKKVPSVTDPDPAAPNAWKFERFVFDVIPLANHVVCLEVPREEQFLPVKDADGPFGPDGVRQSYQDYFGRGVERVLGKKPPGLEVDPGVSENARELIDWLKDNRNAKHWDLEAPLHITDASTDKA